MDEEKRLYTIDELCKEVRISRSTYFQMRRDGEGPNVTILGGVHLVSREEMLRWLAKHTERRWITVT